MTSLFHRIIYYLNVIIWRFQKFLINRGHFFSASQIWRAYFYFFSRPKWNDWHSQIANFFYFHGEIKKAKMIFSSLVKNFDKKGVDGQYSLIGVRFLREFPTAIGHIAEVDNFVKMTILEMRTNLPAIMVANEKVSNKEYLAYWEDYLVIINDRIAYSLLGKIYPYIEDRIAAIKDSDDQFFVDYEHELRSKVQKKWEEQKRPPLLKFKTDSLDDHWTLLEANGIPRGSNFVTIHVRCEGNLNRAARDADISTYISTILFLREKGYYVIRCGDKRMPKLKKIKGVFDYAHSKIRNDGFDLFVVANARFMITTTSGPAWVAPTFGVPCVNTNVFPHVHRSYFHADICITKLFKVIRSEEYLPLKTFLDDEKFRSESIVYLEKKGYKIRDNTEDEIMNAVCEMLRILEGGVFSDQEIESMDRFNASLEEFSPHKNSKISPYFANKWKELL